MMKALMGLSIILLCQGFSAPSLWSIHSKQRNTSLRIHSNNNHHHEERFDHKSSLFSSPQSRRDLIGQSIMGMMLLSTSSTRPARAAETTPNEETTTTVTGEDFTSKNDSNLGGENVLYKTKSGLKYVELKKGTGISPRYGNFVRIHYKGSIVLPENIKKREFYEETDMLLKHGNGRMMKGLDEGIHTMRVGGIRRLIIPPKLGYTTIADGVVGPVPESPFVRYRLNNLLDKMVEQRGGSLVLDVELFMVREDEADQGYYEDYTPDPEEFAKMQAAMQERMAKAKSQGLANAIQQAPML